MTPVEQTITDEGRGNCVAACIASILELPLERLPNFNGAYWWDQWQTWLASANLSLLGVRTGDTPRGYAILTAVSPRLPDRYHAVVMHDGVVVWDPHPQRDMGIGDRHAYYLIHALDPTKPIDLTMLPPVPAEEPP